MRVAFVSLRTPQFLHRGVAREGSADGPSDEDARANGSVAAAEGDANGGTPAADPVANADASTPGSDAVDEVTSAADAGVASDVDQLEGAAGDVGPPEVDDGDVDPPEVDEGDVDPADLDAGAPEPTATDDPDSGEDPGAESGPYGRTGSDDAREYYAARRLQRTAELLATRGHEVTVCCAQWWGGDEPAFEQDGVVYRRVCEEASPVRFAARLPFVLRKLDPEVVHARSEPPAGVVAARTAAALLRVPVVADWWASPRQQPGRLSERGHGWAARLPQLVFTPSQTERTRIREYGADAEAVRVIPESVDMDLVREADPESRADVVYARDLDEDANVESFLLALAELRDRDWRASVIGDGPARAEAEATAADLRIDDRVEFLGDLPDEERVPILKGAHVFAQTARRETFPTDLLWALACGCVGLVEYQADSAAHELVEGSDRHALVTSPQELAEGIVAAAGAEHRTVEESFADYDHEAVLERYLACYREVMGEYGLI